MVFAVVVLLPPASASAHAVLVGSDPPSGAALATSPAAVRLRFSEDISARLSSAEVHDAAGRLVAGGGIEKAARTITVRPPRLPVGAYGVVWQVVAADGHVSGGIVVFTVGGAAPARGVGSVTGTTLDRFGLVLRWLTLCLLACVIGGLAFVGLVLGPARRDRVPSLVGPALVAAPVVRRRMLALAVGCAALLAVIDLGRRDDLWLPREGVLVLLALVATGLLLAGPGPGSGRLWAAAPVLVGLAAWIQASGSHAGGLGTFTLAADAVHVLAGCVWLGAVAALVVIAWPGVDGRRDLLKACRGRLARLVILSGGVVAATGLYGAGREIDSFSRLFGSAYGRVLLIKLGLVLALAGLGLANAVRRSASRRLVHAEAAVGVLLLLAVGVLTETPPREAAQSAAASQSVGGTAGDLVVSLSVSPNVPGVNGFIVLAASTRRPAPAPVDDVVLDVAYGGRTAHVPLQRIEVGRYAGMADVDLAGPARASVIVHRAGESPSVPLTWSVGSQPGAGAAAGSRTPLAAFVNPASLALTAAVFGVGLWWLIRGRRRVTVRSSSPVEEVR